MIFELICLNLTFSDLIWTFFDLIQTFVRGMPLLRLYLRLTNCKQIDLLNSELYGTFFFMLIILYNLVGRVFDSYLSKLIDVDESENDKK